MAAAAGDTARRRFIRRWSLDFKGEEKGGVDTIWWKQFITIMSAN